MRLFCTIMVCSIALVCLAQDVYKPANADEKVDLPVPKPTRPAGWEDANTDEEGEADDDDDEENPPIEFFDEEIEGNKVVYVMDKTESMKGRLRHPIIDENGNIISNPTKMDHLKAEFAKSVMGLSENVEFSAVMFSTGGVVDGKFRSITKWRNHLVKATAANKASAIAWAKKFYPCGGTPLYDAFVVAASIPGVKVILLHTDGVADCWRKPSPEEAAEGIVALAKSKGIVVYTFGHCLATFYESSLANRGKKCLKKIADDTGGTYTDVN